MNEPDLTEIEIDRTLNTKLRHVAENTICTMVQDAFDSKDLASLRKCIMLRYEQYRQEEVNLVSQIYREQGVTRLVPKGSIRRNR